MNHDFLPTTAPDAGARKRVSAKDQIAREIRRSNQMVYDEAARGPQPPPNWLLTEAFEDTELGVLKEGKEAVCHLVERRDLNGPTSHLLVAKRYRDVAQRAFRADAVYRSGRRTGNSRTDRAIATGTRKGMAMAADTWSAREFEVLSGLWRTGLAVPYPVARHHTEILLEYLGDEASAAPRLVHARLSPEAASRALDGVLDVVGGMLDLGWVHGDLSAYNVLWWNDRAYVIDFPQTVDIGTNPVALDLLHHDVTQMCTWAKRRGHHRDPETTFADLVSRAWAG